MKRPWEQKTDAFVQYPSTMLLTADHDDRVVPLHTFKLLAVSLLSLVCLLHLLLLLPLKPVLLWQTMQYELGLSLENSPQTNPIIARIEVKAGHGAGRPTQKIVSNQFNIFLFIIYT